MMMEKLIFRLNWIYALFSIPAFLFHELCHLLMIFFCSKILSIDIQNSSFKLSITWKRIYYACPICVTYEGSPILIVGIKSILIAIAPLIGVCGVYAISLLYSNPIVVFYVILYARCFSLSSEDIKVYQYGFRLLRVWYFRKFNFIQ